MAANTCESNTITPYARTHMHARTQTHTHTAPNKIANIILHLYVVKKHLCTLFGFIPAYLHLHQSSESPAYEVTKWFTAINSILTFLLLG